MKVLQDRKKFDALNAISNAVVTLKSDVNGSSSKDIVERMVPNRRFGCARTPAS